MTIAKTALTEFAQKALVHRARYAFPREVCGFIMTSFVQDREQFIFEVPNVAKKPEHSWTMDPDWQALAMRDQEAIFGIWHTHPHGPDGPSDTDYRYMIPGLRFFVATRNGVFEYEMREQA
jgi:proteasome lid subunit RPN8/RPN11